MAKKISRANRARRFKKTLGMATPIVLFLYAVCKFLKELTALLW
jgi:hypothetical protein